MRGVLRLALQVLAITSSTCPSVIFRGCPGRGSSNNPPGGLEKPPPPQLTVLRCTPSRDASAVLLSPPASGQHDPGALRQRRRSRAPAHPPPNTSRSSRESSIGTAVGLGITESYYCTETNDSQH